MFVGALLFPFSPPSNINSVNFYSQTHIFIRIIVNQRTYLSPSELYFYCHLSFLSHTFFEAFLLILPPHNLSWTYPCFSYILLSYAFFLGRLSYIRAKISHFPPTPFIHTLTISNFSQTNTLVELSSSCSIKLFDS